jgi:4-amino-4-deoxy-L-arabinose transferase-like glycosyltransferase
MTQSATASGSAGARLQESAADPWLSALSLICACALLRLVYLIWLTPYDLVGDEAYYWAQARHLDWSYREKGPLLAWAIALCCRLFGDVEWAVRLPVVLSALLAAWIVGRLTLSLTRGNRRAALLAVIAFLLVPAFEANAQICTQDGPLIALLGSLTWIGLGLVRRWEAGQNTWVHWIALWALLGIGILLKQSVLLFATALPLYAAIRFRRLPMHPILIAQQLVGVGLFLVIISPIVIWERRHGWPMLAHTLGHLGIGPDHATKSARSGPLAWIGTTVGSLIGATGPFLVVAIWASWRAVRHREDDPDRRADRLWILCAAWPGVLFFVALSFVKSVVPSWPLPSLVPLTALVGEMASTELPRGWSSSRDAFARWWRFLIAYGVGAAVLIMFPTLLLLLPFIGPKIQKPVISRIRGNRDECQAIARVAMQVATPDHRRPIIVTPHYMKASLYSFYLPGACRSALVVTTSGGYVGARPSNFDTWNDTRLSNPLLRGRSLLLVGGDAAEWACLLRVDSVNAVATSPMLYLATNFQGRVRDEGAVLP